MILGVNGLIINIKQWNSFYVNDVNLMDQEELIKLTYFGGYNYFLRSCNIKRKIDNLETNSESLKNIIKKNYKPFIFQGGSLSKNGQEIAKVKKIEVKIESEKKIISNKKLTVKSIDPEEKAKPFLIVDIIAETTQYCADLASAMIGLRDYQTNKFTYLNVKDSKIRDWYLKLDQPTFDDFLKILNFPKIHMIKPGERLSLNLKYERILWKLKKIGKFYNNYYKYIYTPYRHNMKISFWEDDAGRIWCRTLTEDKKYNFFYISQDRLNQCLDIVETIYDIFHNELGSILFSKHFTLFKQEKKIREIKAPSLPYYPVNDKIIQIFDNLKEFSIHYFPINDIPKISKFINSRKTNIKFKYFKKTNTISIDGKKYLLDEFWAYYNKFNKNELLLLYSCPLSLFIELAVFTVRENNILNEMYKNSKDIVLNYLVIKDISFFSKNIVKRVEMMNSLVDQIMNDFLILFSIYVNSEKYERITFKEEEINYLKFHYETKILKILNQGEYMKKFYEDHYINLFILILIIDYFQDYSSEIDSLSKTMKNDLNVDIKELAQILIKIKNKGLNFNDIIYFFNDLFDKIDNRLAS